MATNPVKTIAAIQDDMSTDGWCDVPFETFLYVRSLAAFPDNDEEFEKEVATFVDEYEWIISFDINWINRRVMFKGPITVV